MMGKHDDDMWPRFDTFFDKYEDEDEGYEGRYAPEEKTCDYCGEEGLFWIKTEHGYRLTKDRKLHICHEHDHSEFA